MNILIALPSEVAFDQLQPLVSRTEVEISRVFDGPSAMTMAVGSRFDLLVVGHPMPNIEFADFFRRVRSPESACCRAPTLILTRSDSSDVVAEYLDDLARSCPIDAPTEQIQALLAELIGVALRAKARLAVELSARLENESLQLYCQTVNVSEGGMFIRSRRALPLGTEVQLTLSLPGEPESIKAVGEVLRQTTSGADSIEGLAIRFVEVEGDGRTRLANFVAEHEHTFLGLGSD
jgi:uncharacterized protein (TIGR02266 family)